MEDPAQFGILVAVLVVVVTALVALFIIRKHAEGSPSASPSELPKEEAAQGSKSQHAKGKKLTHKHGHADKAPRSHHPLDLNTLKGHAEPITGMAFSFDGRALATACEDGVIRVFKLEDVTAKSFKFLRMSLPPGVHTPRGVAFGHSTGELLVSATDTRGGCIFMFGPASGQEAEVARAQGRLPPPEIKWEHRKAHDGKDISTTVSACATFGSGDGAAIAATCSQDGTDVRLWTVTDGKSVAKVDSNQLRNTMAAISSDGRFLAIAAFTADVKIFELLYAKDGSVRDVTKVMQLKGHQSAVTWLSFTWDNKRIVTTSKDGTVKMWNLDVRYLLSEDPKCLRTFPIPEPPPAVKQRPHVLDRIAVSPDDRVLAVSIGEHLQWIDLETGAVVDAAEGAHDSNILWMAWSPKPHRTGQGQAHILATGGVDRKVKLWKQPNC